MTVTMISVLVKLAQLFARVTASAQNEVVTDTLVVIVAPVKGYLFPPVGASYQSVLLPANCATLKVTEPGPQRDTFGVMAAGGSGVAMMVI